MKIIDDIQDEAIYAAIIKSIQKPDPFKLRVTELIDSPRIKRLRLAHWDDMVQPASKFLYRLRGTLMHDLVAMNAPADNLTEKTLKITITRGNAPEQYHMPIYGTPDRYTSQEELLDYKYTSMWAFIRTKQEWINQLNIYRHMLEVHGFEVKKMTIKAILDDWSASEAFRNPDYPSSPFKAVDIPRIVNIESYINERVDAHIASVTNMPLCSPEERWTKPTTWAVTKKGLQKAKAVFGTEKRPGTKIDAERFIKENFPLKYVTLYDVVERPGRHIRCEAYCDVAPFCTQWQKDRANVAEEAEA